MRISQLNTMTLVFGFNAWGRSHQGQTSKLFITVENNQPKIEKLVIYPEGKELTETIDVDDVALFNWNTGEQDSDGDFMISDHIQKNTLLTCKLRLGQWLVIDQDEDQLKFLTEGGISLPQKSIEFLNKVYCRALHDVLW